MFYIRLFQSMSQAGSRIGSVYASRPTSPNAPIRAGSQATTATAPSTGPPASFGAQAPSITISEPEGHGDPQRYARPQKLQQAQYQQRPPQRPPQPHLQVDPHQQYVTRGQVNSFSSDIF